MMQSKNLEINVGIFMVISLGALFILAMRVSNLSILWTEKSYDITARFQNIGNLKERSPVKIAGVRIGQVSGINFDGKTFEAVVKMRIHARYNTLPQDTSASILTSGLLGEQYVGLDPGGERATLTNGDQIRLTQSALVLEQFIGQFLYNKVQESAKQ